MMTERRIPSSDGKHKLYCRVYQPEGEIKGLFHVVHGMVEHIARYDLLMTEMAAAGYVCYGFDNLGHGNTADSYEELGYLGTWKNMVDDVRNVSLLMKKDFGEELPCYLLGHSMGSFIVRCGATPKIWNKLIIMGTGGPNPISIPGLAMIKLKIKLYGDHACDPFIEKMAVGGYCKKFAEENDIASWISSKEETRDEWRTDKFCSFHFTLNGYETLVKLQMLANSKAWFKNIRADLPILLVSGELDPVGDFGRGVTAVYEKLKQNGKDVRMKLYKDNRHEILNDTAHDEVVADILSFISE